MCEGVADELDGIHLGDERLNQRSRLVLEALAANPQASINGAHSDWGATLAAYRLFDNPALTPAQILEPHRCATVRRMQEHPVVLIAQDTTELDYSLHPTKDMRCLNQPKRRGLYHHVHLAVTPDRLPLGVVGTENFDRHPDSLGQSKERESLPIEDKESHRWLKGYRLACQLAAECPQTQIVSIGDREADVYDIFVDAQQQTGPRADFVIRARAERCTKERNLPAGRHAYHKVREKVRSAEILATRTIHLPTTPKRKKREATLAVRGITVEVKPPHARSSLPSVKLNVVLVEEMDGPGDGSDVSWLLITTMPIDTMEKVMLVVDYYVARWSIEIYFKNLKSGCEVEKIQLETNSRLFNCLAFYNIIAWRVVYLTYLNRTCPELPCTTVFEDAEWKSVWCIVTKKRLPPKPPTLSEFMKLVTALGGYNNRAKEKAAGPLPVWIGLRRMLDFATAWINFGPKDEVVYK